MAKTLFKKGQIVRFISLWSNNRKEKTGVICYEDIKVISCGQKQLVLDYESNPLFRSHLIKNLYSPYNTISIIAIEDLDNKESAEVQRICNIYNFKEYIYTTYEDAKANYC